MKSAIAGRTKLHGETVKALALSEIRDHRQRAGIEPTGSTSEQFAQQVRDDIAKFTKIARQPGIRAECRAGATGTYLDRVMPTSV
jgi:tripartite-type tricarboxylate transporter receptor subunit TctC